MDPISMIVGALAAGAAMGLQATATTALKDAYIGLRELVRRRVADIPAAEEALVEHEKAPEEWQAPLTATLEVTGAGNDEQIIEAAQRVLVLAGEAQKYGIPPSKYRVDLMRSQGSQVGADNTFTFTPTREWRFDPIAGDLVAGDLKKHLASASAKDDVELVTELPAFIYLAVGKKDTVEHVKTELQALAEQMGFHLTADSDAKFGSFWQRFRAKASNPQTQEALHDRLVKLERSAEVRLLAVPESQANMQNAQGLAAIIESLKGEPAAVVQLGPLLVVKTPAPDVGSAILCRTLTAKELRLLETHPELLKDPGRLMAQLTASDHDRELEQA